MYICICMCMCACVYVYIYMYVCVYIYIYIHILYYAYIVPPTPFKSLQTRGQDGISSSATEAERSTSTPSKITCSKINKVMVYENSLGSGWCAKRSVAPLRIILAHCWVAGILFMIFIGGDNLQTSQNPTCHKVLATSIWAIHMGHPCFPRSGE